MYTEATPQSPGDNAKLQLAVPRSNSTSCLTFFFHMYGSGMGTLNVFSGDTMIFTASGDHGHRWIKGTRTVNSSDVVSMPKFCGESSLIRRIFDVKTIETCLDMCTCLNARLHFFFFFSLA